MKIKDLMTPVGDYQTIGMDASMKEVVSVLTGGKHRDVLVVDGNGAFTGVVTMTDIIMALEPNYRKLKKSDLASDILSNRFVADQFEKYALWTDTLSALCAQSINLTAKDIMHVPDDAHYINEEAELEHGVHMYVVGTPQPLIVRANGTVTGVLRMADVFNEIIKRMSECSA